jgi:flagellar motor switch protein FliG
VRRSEVEKARKEMIDAALQLEASGELDLGREGD